MGSGNTSKSKVKVAVSTITNHYNQVLFEKNRSSKRKKRHKRTYKNNLRIQNAMLMPVKRSCKKIKRNNKRRWQLWRHNWHSCKCSCSELQQSIRSLQLRTAVKRMVSTNPRPPQQHVELARNRNQPRNTEGNCGENEETCQFGDKMKKKKDTMRIAFLNVGGLRFESRNRHRRSYKSKKWRKFMLDYKVDCFGGAESNIDWRIPDGTLNLWQRMDGMFKMRRIAQAYNQQVSSMERNQIGGVFQIMTNELLCRVTDIKSDRRCLGRWTSMLIRGKNGLITRIAMVYCACKSSGTGSAYFQQQEGLLLDGITACPREQFYNDLCKEITQWKANGEQLIIMGDWNIKFQDVRRWMEEMGLKEIICENHGYDEAPATYHRSKNSPIDGIWCSPLLVAAFSGYAEWGFLAGDHRLLWFDIPEFLLLGFNKHDLVPPLARRLRQEDPRTVKNIKQHSIPSSSNTICITE